MSDLATHELNLSYHSSFHELAEAHQTTTQDTHTTSAAGVPVPGLTFTIAPGDKRPYRIRFGGILYADVANVGVYLDLREDGFLVARTGITTRGANFVSWRRGQRRFLPAQVTHTYALYLLSANNVANVHCLTDATAGALAFIQAITG